METQLSPQLARCMQCNSLPRARALAIKKGIRQFYAFAICSQGASRFSHCFPWIFADVPWEFPSVSRRYQGVPNAIPRCWRDVQTVFVKRLLERSHPTAFSVHFLVLNKTWRFRNQEYRHQSRLAHPTAGSSIAILDSRNINHNINYSNIIASAKIQLIYIAYCR